jgi:chemotaxis protein CheD
MNPLHTGLPVIHLKPGEVYFSEKPELVSIILGSCVAVIMFNPRLKRSAICHSMLPHDSKKHPETRPQPDDFKYLDQAFNTMYDWFVHRDIKDHEIIVKVFGGGKVLQFSDYRFRHRYGVNGKSIGTQNIDAALRLILNKNLKIAAIDAGGDIGRKLFFYTHTGDVLLKRVKKAGIPQAASKLEYKGIN